VLINGKRATGQTTDQLAAEVESAIKG